MKQNCNLNAKTFLFCYLMTWFLFPLHSQCLNTKLFPTEQVVMGNFNEMVVISDTQKVGQYAVIKNLQTDKQYTISSTGVNDYITIRDYYDPAVVLVHGVNPIIYTVSAGMPDIIAVHFNLQLPPCGVENIYRRTTIQCNDCSSAPLKTAVGKRSPEAILDIAGEIKLASLKTHAMPGSIQWNPATQDFEGYDGTQWRSFTKANGYWGALENKIANESQKIIGDSVSVLDRCGVSLSIDGNWAAVGCYTDSVNGNNRQGSVYIFKKSGNHWIQHSKVTAADGTELDEFGTSVSLSGDFLAVGAPKTSFGTMLHYGAVYIFRRFGNSWVQQAKIYDPMGEAFDEFGKAVMLKNGVLAIGCSNCTVPPITLQGKVWIYRNNGSSWDFEAEITSSDAQFFGASLSISGNDLVVGAPLTMDGMGNSTGACYVYNNTGQIWNFVSKLSEANLSALSSYGQCVAIHQNWLAVGVPNHLAGKVNIYERINNNWNFYSQLTPNTVDDDFKFGNDLSMVEQLLVVGAPGFDRNSGQAYIYNNPGTGWKFNTLLRSKDRFLNDRFGIKVFATPETIMIGSYFTNAVFGRGKYYTYLFNRN